MPADSAEPQAFRPMICVKKSNAMQPTFIQSREFCVALLAAWALMSAPPSAAQGGSGTSQQFEVSAVYFPTHAHGAFFEVADTPRGATELVGYVYKPKGRGL
jgi:hypothetical protein